MAVVRVSATIPLFGEKDYASFDLEWTEDSNDGGIGNNNRLSMQLPSEYLYMVFQLF